jgi:hypothetical protein
MRVAAWIAAALALVSAQACVTSAESDDPPTAATFRRGAAVEFYDFSLSISHAGSGAGLRGSNCSNAEFHCFAGVSVLIAPRRCAVLRRLVRSRADWRIGDAVQARFLFVSESQLYYASNAAGGEADSSSDGAGGFVYDIERGVVGVWRSQAALRAPLDRDAMGEIVDSTKWLESPRTLFACA